MLSVPSPAITSPQPRAPRRHRRSLAQKLARAWAYLGYGLQMLPPMLLPIFPNRSVAGQVCIGERVIRYYRHWPTDPQLMADWDALSQQVPGATVFQSPHWQRAVCRFGDSLGTLRLVTVHRGDRLQAVLPLERKWRGHWCTPGRLTTDYHDPLVHPDDAADTWRALLTALPQLARSPLRSVVLDPISPTAPCRSIIADVETSAGFTAIDDVASTGTTIELADTWDAYVARLDGHQRKELRRKIRKARERGRARFVVNDTPLAVRYALENAFALMEASGGGKGRKSKWLFRPHFRQAAPSLASSGRLIVYELYIEDRLSASLIALPQDGRQVLWSGAIDRGMRCWSPGIVLFGLVFARAIEQGQPAIDLLRGQYPYKYAMGATDRPLHRLTLLKKN